MARQRARQHYAASIPHARAPGSPPAGLPSTGEPLDSLRYELAFGDSLRVSLVIRERHPINWLRRANRLAQREVRRGFECDSQPFDLTRSLPFNLVGGQVVRLERRVDAMNCGVDPYPSPWVIRRTAFRG